MTSPNPAIRIAGGPRGRGAARFTWEGATVLRQWEAQIQAGMETLAEEIESDLRSNLHRVTDEMADNAFANVEVRGGKRTITAGSTAPHTAYHELGTSRYSAHPQIRQTIDRYAPRLTERIAAARRGR